MHRHSHTAALLPAITLALSLLGCDQAETPERRIRALIDAAEAAAEHKEIGTLRGYVSERYADDDGRDRRTIDGILRIYLPRHEKIHLLTRIERIALVQPNRAEAVIYVAMAARPIANAEELAGFRADYYRFELGFIEEGAQWRVVRAAWRPAELADFVYRPTPAP